MSILDVMALCIGLVCVPFVFKLLYRLVDISFKKHPKP